MRIPAASRAVALWIGVLAVLGEFRAAAFERSQYDTTKVCLWWKSRTITFMANQNCSEDIRPAGDCFEAVKASLAAWTQPCSDLRLQYGGTTAETAIGFDEQHWNNNINLIVWRETKWEDPESPEYERNAIALTTTTFDQTNGEMVDADVEVNGVWFTFSAGRAPNGNTDVQNTLVHELGHGIGLGHSSDPEATMYLTAGQGETKKRDLAKDDIDGLCWIYPLSAETVLCVDPPPKYYGCACSGSGSRGNLLCLLLVPVLAWRASRRRYPRRNVP